MECVALIPCLAFPVIAALAVVGIVYGLRQAKRRQQALQALAYQMGFDFHPDDPWDLPARYHGFDAMSRGSGRKASNVLVGELDGGTAVTAFDYRYTTGSGKNRTTHHRQIVVLGLPIHGPRLRLRTENVLDRVASWVGHDDIDFESDAFSRRYHVSADDRRFAYDIFHARLIDYLLMRGDVPSLEMNGSLMLLATTRGGPEDVQRLVEIGGHIIATIPDYVRKSRPLHESERALP